MKSRCSGLEVAESSVECVLVVRARRGCVPSQSSYSVGKVGAGPQHGVHEGTDHALVLLHIDFSHFELCEMLICEGGSANTNRPDI